MVKLTLQDSVGNEWAIFNRFLQNIYILQLSYIISMEYRRIKVRSSRRIVSSVSNKNLLW